jgi:hypothetical protein
MMVCDYQSGLARCPSVVMEPRNGRPSRSAFYAAWLLVAGQLMVGVAWTDQFKQVVIDNSQPRRDTGGQIVDAHDGCLRFFEGKYYLYGTRYGDTDGGGKTNRYVVYSSTNLKDWTNEGVILENVPRRVYFRPSVIYNERTHKYVLWYNADGKMGLATADRPQGPFSEVNGGAAMSHGHKGTDNTGGTGDLSLFVDDDGTAYIAYSYDESAPSEEDAFKRWFTSKEPIPHHQIVVEQLTADYLGSAGRVTKPIAGNVEAPAMFRRGNSYYLLFDNTCAICSAGTGVRVYIAQHPLGPFTYKGNINRDQQKSRGLPSPWTFPGTGRKDAIIKAQQNYVAALPGPNSDQYLWMGDRWGSAPDDIMGHDFQYWGVLSFDPDGMIEQLRNQDFWTIEIPAPAAAGVARFDETF